METFEKSKAKAEILLDNFYNGYIKKFYPEGLTAMDYYDENDPYESEPWFQKAVVDSGLEGWLVIKVIKEKITVNIWVNYEEKTHARKLEKLISSLPKTVTIFINDDGEASTIEECLNYLKNI